MCFVTFSTHSERIIFFQLVHAPDGVFWKTQTKVEGEEKLNSSVKSVRYLLTRRAKSFAKFSYHELPKPPIDFGKVVAFVLKKKQRRLNS